jgi:YHS domain-containing protein
MGTKASKVKDPVCGMHVDPATKAITRTYDGVTYYFCAQGCAHAFYIDPNVYARRKRTDIEMTGAGSSSCRPS